jgi:hypothetical protein
MYQWYNWRNTGAWWTRDQFGRPISPPVWEGPDQVEDRSVENIQLCYRFLRGVPYQGPEDRARLDELERIAIAEAVLG